MTSREQRSKRAKEQRSKKTKEQRSKETRDQESKRAREQESKRAREQGSKGANSHPSHMTLVTKSCDLDENISKTCSSLVILLCDCENIMLSTDHISRQPIFSQVLSFY